MMMTMTTTMTTTATIGPVGPAGRRIGHTSESGMTLIAVMGLMVILAVALLAVAPTVQLEVQRDKELESIRRGEEVERAIEQYVIYYRGTKLPESIDDLLEGLPQGTKKRMILRPSAATDPLSEDGQWRLIQPEPQVLASFARRVQEYNNGVLPSNSSQIFDRWAVTIVNAVSSED
jgi:type II secretory pathway pseudopilin PulG